MQDNDDKETRTDEVQYKRRIKKNPARVCMLLLCIVSEVKKANLQQLGSTISQHPYLHAGKHGGRTRPPYIGQQSRSYVGHEVI